MDKIVVLIFVLFLSPLFSFGQDSLAPFQENQMEDIADNLQNEEADLSDLTEILQGYRKNPINLNSTSKETLQSLGLLNDIQIANLLAHKEKYGDLISIYELQSIDGFDIATIRLIYPYVTTKPGLSYLSFRFKHMILNSRREVIIRGQQVLEEQRGFSAIDSAGLTNSPNSRYIGSPQRIYTRFRLTYGPHLSIGITAEKDPGELLFKKNLANKYPGYKEMVEQDLKNGFDFYSAHFFVRGKGLVKTIAVGDFQAGFGQGLITWSGIGGGKSSEGVNIRRNAAGLRPHTSTDENLFMRGAGFTLGLKKFQLTALGSYKKIDANLSAPDTSIFSDEALVTSLQTSGYHSTVGELQDKQVLGEMIFGGNLAWKGTKFNAGITGMHMRYDPGLKRTLELYNQFEFSGTSLTNLGFDYGWVLRNMNFFGETAISDNGGYAVLNGLMIAADPKLSFTILHRYYDKSYQGIRPSAFGEASKNNNEHGFYLGFNAKLSPAWTLSGYYDHFIFPWLKYQVSAPSQGSDLLTQLDFTPNKKLGIYLRYRKRDRFKDLNVTDDLDYPVEVKQNSLRFNLSYQLTKAFRIRTRVEYLFLEKPGQMDAVLTEENGYLIYQDLIYKNPGKRFAGSLRYGIFQTDSYDSRLYTYENDVPGAWSIPALYYSGTRTYLNLSYDLAKGVELWMRASQTWYSNRDIISEGSLTEIKDNTKTELKAMLRLTF